MIPHYLSFLKDASILSWNTLLDVPILNPNHGMERILFQSNIFMCLQIIFPFFSNQINIKWRWFLIEVFFMWIDWCYYSFLLTCEFFRFYVPIFLVDRLPLDLQLTIHGYQSFSDKCVLVGYSEFQLIHELCLYVLSASQRAELIRATLSTLHAFLSWIPLGYIFESPLVCTMILHSWSFPYIRNYIFWHLISCVS